MLLVIGCGDDDIQIEIHGDGSTQRIELFVASAAPCKATDCPGIRPPEVSAALDGTVYYRDRDDEPAFASDVDDGGVAYFRMRPGAAFSYVNTLIAVGYGEQGVTGAAILRPFDAAAGPIRIVATLAPVTGTILGTTPGPAGDRVQVWGEKPGDKVGCLGIERWKDDGSLALRQFVVPEEDPDCDQVLVAEECRPLEHATTIRPTLGSVTCLEPLDGACRLGGETCVDGEGATACGPSAYCLPDRICDECATLDPACIAGRFLQNAQAYVTCTLSVELDPSTNRYQPCANLPLRTPLDLSAVFDGAAHCTGAMFNELELPAGSFMPGLRIPRGAIDPIATLTALAPVSTTGCRFDLEFAGHIGELGIERRLISLAASNGNFLLVPFVLQVIQGCDEVGTSYARFECKETFQPNGVEDAIESCAR